MNDVGTTHEDLESFLRATISWAPGLDARGERRRAR